MSAQPPPTPPTGKLTEGVTSDDVLLAEEVAWTMALEGRKLSTAGYTALVQAIMEMRVGAVPNVAEHPPPPTDPRAHSVR